MSTSPISSPSQPLLGLSLDELRLVAQREGLPAFVGGQLADWIYRKRARSFSEMTNLSKAARTRLSERYVVGFSEPVDVQRSVDGTAKYLYRTSAGHFVETVYIPDASRATVCVSSQVGCKMGCAFCMTGRQGFAAQLSPADILNQMLSMPEVETLTNAVFMGQGEPFDNLDAVLAATRAMTAEWGLGWSPRRITVSSVGLAKGLQRFVEESECHLAISLHHPLSDGRAALMPAERSFSIESVVGLLAQYPFFRRREAGRSGFGTQEQSRQRRLSFEYIVFDGVNDSLRHADALLRLLAPLDCRVNLIRFHSIPDTPLAGTSDERMLRLRDYLTQHGLFTTIRASRGQDIFAACGLLSTKKQEEARGL